MVLADAFWIADNDDLSVGLIVFIDMDITIGNKVTNAMQ